MFMFLKGGSQKIISNFNLRSLFFIKSRTSWNNILVFFSILNLLIFFFKISNASFSFSTNKTYLASLDKHSSPNDPPDIK